MALTADAVRTTYGTNTAPMTIPVKAGQKFYKGSIVTVKSGLAYNATASDNTHVAVGVAYIATDATNAPGDGVANGGFDLIVEPGTFGDFTPDAASNNPTFANRLSTGYIVDDDTISTSSNTNARCTVTIYDVSDDGTNIVAQFNEVLP
jgi:hypothetical protein